jgi:gamma-glutamyltranspeptidase/glutathione hydrolase
VVSALLTMLSHYGTMRFHQVVESALSFARDGFPAYQLLHRAIGSPDRLPNLQKYPDSARIYLPHSQPPALGSLFVQQDLARTLTLMVEAEQQALGHGQSREAALQAARDVIYKGDVARRVHLAIGGANLDKLSGLSGLHQSYLESGHYLATGVEHPGRVRPGRPGV